MARIVSFVVLVAILLVIAVLFFRVMASFLLPMFLAVLLVIMFGPLHRWFIIKCRGRDRVAAGLTTASILLILMIPLVLILVPAWLEWSTIYSSEDTDPNRTEQGAQAEQGERADPVEYKDTNAEVPKNAEAQPDAMDLRKVAASTLVELGEKVGLSLSPEDVEQTISAKAQQWLTPLALSTTHYVGGFLVGLGVMVMSLYYFLADGPEMIRTIMRLSPLDDKYEEQLIEEFDNMTRAVVVATLLSAIAQGLLAGVGFYLAGLPFVFLLTALAMLFAMVPFVGTALVWVPACLWLYFHDERASAAIILAIFCMTIVAMADNLIKPIVLHGRSNLHPLLALLSVLGGVQALGPIGIFVGPMVVAFLQTLLNMLHTELDAIGNELSS
jgi:predicted PurR-regulated permease PerM